MKKTSYIATAAIILLIIVTKISAKVSVSTRSQHLPGQKFGYSINSRKDNRLIYTVCDNGDVQRKCKVVQEDIFSGNVTYSCDIILKINQKGMKFGLFLEFAFGNDKAILIWEEKNGFKMYVRFTTIQFSDCHVGEAKLLDANESLERDPIHHQLYIGQKIITHDNKYDVFYEDEATCGKQECKFSIDAEGKIINKPIAFVNNSPYHIRLLKLISKSKPLEVFTSLKMNKNKTILTMIKPAVSEKTAVTFDSKETEIVGYSVEHETVGLCTRSKNTNITCSQYDIDGNLKSQVNLPDVETHLSSMYVLPNGGFLLLNLKVEFCQPSDDNCDKYPISANYWITKVDTTGKTKQLGFDGFNKTRIGKYSEFIYVNPNGEGYCATVVYSKYVPTTKIMDAKVEDRNIVTNCFTVADF